jgi:hypothetical protein
MKKLFFTIVIVFGLLSGCGPDYKSSLLETNTVNQDKWQKKGSPDYVIKVHEVALRATAGVSVLTVKHGVVESVVVDKPGNPGPEAYSDLTIDGLFAWADWCANQSPGLVCTINYDPQYGYPSYVNVDCTRPPDQCGEVYLTITVLEVKMLP